MVAVVLLAVITGPVGCGGSGPEEKRGRAGPGGSTTVPSGYVEFADAETGFAMAIPEDWEVPRNAELLQQQADAVREQNPGLADVLYAAMTLINKAEVFALNPESSSSVNLLVEAARGVTLDEIPEPAIAALRRRGATVQSQERTTLGGAPAGKLAIRSPITPDTIVDQVQYYAISGDKVFILTLTGRDPALDVIAESVRLT